MKKKKLKKKNKKSINHFEGKKKLMLLYVKFEMVPKCPTNNFVTCQHIWRFDSPKAQKPKIYFLFVFIFFSSHQFYFSQLSPFDEISFLSHISQIAKNLREKIVESKTKTKTKKMEFERSSRSTASAFFVKSFRLQFLVVLTLLLV